MRVVAILAIAVASAAALPTAYTPEADGGNMSKGIFGSIVGNGNGNKGNGNNNGNGNASGNSPGSGNNFGNGNSPGSGNSIGNGNNPGSGNGNGNEFGNGNGSGNKDNGNGNSIGNISFGSIAVSPDIDILSKVSVSVDLYIPPSKISLSGQDR
ncbi:hypothetical protein CKM354_000300700 [Cercospora kikuchii]|uniref:Uncharacterized protein n=1 Tax=Cercospora kikuchii TaxID=84275 RepID=A0A9P3F9V1_9PEZI|nr:uncharacterized protein CKM354_000300700 [Cercospora kikuchii]GIZ39631.1 hypothetical protein CKM354_000300700 [Cercospora kikuchii]